MEQPNVSIYDMLIKHHRQQLKEDCPEQQQEQEEDKRPKGKTPSNNRRTERDPAQRNAKDSSNKTPKFRLARTQPAAVDERPISNMATNVVTASHLTGKQSAILLNTSTNKDVLNQLVSKMTAFNHRQSIRGAGGAAPAVVAAPAPAAASVGVKKRQKTVNKVVSKSSNSSNLKLCRALSPSNPNRLAKKTSTAAAAVPAKGLKRVKSKSSNELKQQRRPKKPLAAMPKDCRQQKPAKVMVNDPESVDVQRYRL